MLFKPRYLDKFAAGIADAMLTYSRNRAACVLVVAEVVRTKFYRDDLGGLVNAMQAMDGKAP